MLYPRLRAGGLALALIFPVLLAGQEQPLSVNGTFSTGYYSTTTRGESNTSLDFVPFGATFDIGGFYKSPDLVYFSVRPELNVGPQASEAGFQGGNGIQLRTTFFRRVVPITFRYVNVQVENVYFGGLTQISGYSLKNRNKDLGLTLELHPHKLPSLFFDGSINSVDSTSGTPGIPDYLAKGNHLNVDSKYQSGKWVFDGFAHRQELQSDLVEPLDDGTTLGTLKQTVFQYQGSARRPFLADSEMYVDAGTQSTSSQLLTLPVDLTTHYAAVNLRFFEKRRWRSSIRASYSSNIASQLLAQAVSSLGGANSVAADQALLLPFSNSVANYNINGLTSAALSHGFGLYGGVERSAVLSSTETAIDASYTTTSGGVTYAHKLGWASVSGEYARQFGLGSITGQSGTIQGQTYRAGAQRGTPDGLQMELTLHGTDQSIHNQQPLSDKSITLEGSLARRIAGSFSARAGGGWQWSTLVNSANEFQSGGYTARAGIEHPRVQLTAALNDTSSDSLPFQSDLLAGLGLGAAAFLPMRVIPSDYRAMNFTLHSNPVRKVEISALWTRSRQHVDSVLNNDFTFMNIFVTYHFRRIQMEGGYIRTDQLFAAYPNTMRKRFYIRIVRSAKLL